VQDTLLNRLFGRKRKKKEEELAVAGHSFIKRVW
jgi:hypothetical protein